jgi:hypothetical protein
MRRQTESQHRSRSFRRLFPLPLRGSCRRSRLRERAHRRRCICSHPGLSPSAARGAAPPSQREGGTNAKVPANFWLSSLLPLRRHLPRGEGRSRPRAGAEQGRTVFATTVQRSALRDIPARTALTRPEQSEGPRAVRVRRARVTIFGDRESRERGGFVKSPSPWRVLSSPSFCTSRKVAPPEGGTHVLIKRTTSLRTFGLSLFRRLRRHLPPREGRGTDAAAAGGVRKRNKLSGTDGQKARRSPVFFGFALTNGPVLGKL